MRATIHVAISAATAEIDSTHMNAAGRQEGSFESMTCSLSRNSQLNAAAKTFDKTANSRKSRNDLTRGCMLARREMLLDVLRIPRPADHAGVDAAHAHAQLSAVPALHFTSLCLDKFRLMHFHIGVQVALGQRHSIEMTASHAEVLGGELPTAADGHAVTERPFARGEDDVG